MNSGEATGRREAILDAATHVFVRYGFKKTSMDDLARAAGLSRQGLYIHFSTKEELFKAALIHLVAQLRGAAREALGREELSIAERLLGAFEAMHGVAIQALSSEHVDELFETAEALVGPLIDDAERAFIDDVAKALRTSGVATAWKELGLSAKDLAEHLQAASHGAKHHVSSAAEYRERMRVAVRIVTHGRARTG